MTQRSNPYTDAWRAFTKNTSDHELVVLNDEGLYRHLRVQAPGTRMWSWDIITWPGHLATAGDVADGFMFTRTTDMLEFFDRPDHLRHFYSDGAPSIDVRYWAEKLCGHRSLDVKVYDSDSFLRQVRESLEDNEEIGLEAQALRDRQIQLLERIHQMLRRYQHSQDRPAVEERLPKHWAGELSSRDLFSYDGLNQAEMDQLGEEFDFDDNGSREELDIFALEWADVTQQPPAERRAEILTDARWHADSEEEAHKWLAANEDHVGTDTFEWDLREYDFHFLLACYAIDHTVQLYRQHRQGLVNAGEVTTSLKEF